MGITFLPEHVLKHSRGGRKFRYIYIFEYRPYKFKTMYHPASADTFNRESVTPIFKALQTILMLIKTFQYCNE